MTIIRFAVLGCGHIGKRHASLIRANSNCNLVALADIRSESETNCEEFNVPYFGELASLLQEGPEFDVLCIATPNGLHEKHALEALRAGKHVIIEKPMALSKSGAERVIYESLRQHKQVFCVMQNRYSPPSLWLKELIDKQILGNIYLVQTSCYWNRDERYYKGNTWHGSKDLDGGTLFTQFSHFVDILYWLFGDIRNINTRLNNFNHNGLTDFEDSGFVSFDFVNGGMGSLNYSTSVWDKNHESSMTVIAENGTVKVGGQYMNNLEYCHIKNYDTPILPPSNPPNNYGSYIGSAANHHFVFENVVNVLNNNGMITTNAMEGLKVVEIIERIYSQAKYKL